MLNVSFVEASAMSDPGQEQTQDEQENLVTVRQLYCLKQLIEELACAATPQSLLTL